MIMNTVISESYAPNHKIIKSKRDLREYLNVELDQ